MGFATDMFSPAPNAHLICAICKDVFDEPHMLQCGHSFCLACLTASQKLAERCPTCRRPCGKVGHGPNISLASMVQELKIHCRNAHEDLRCSWDGKLENWRTHQEKDCLFQPVRCQESGCKHRCLRKDMQDHEREHLENALANFELTKRDAAQKIEALEYKLKRLKGQHIKPSVAPVVEDQVAGKQITRSQVAGARGAEGKDILEQRKVKKRGSTHFDDKALESSGKRRARLCPLEMMWLGSEKRCPVPGCSNMYVHPTKGTGEYNMSFHLTKLDIRGCIKEVDSGIELLSGKLTDDGINKENIVALKAMFARFDDFLHSGFPEEGGVFSGEYVFEFFRFASLNFDNHELFVTFVGSFSKKILDVMGGGSTHTNASKFSAWSATPKLDHFIRCVLCSFDGSNETQCIAKARRYRLHVSSAGVSFKNGMRTLSYYCLSTHPINDFDKEQHQLKKIDREKVSSQRPISCGLDLLTKVWKPKSTWNIQR